MQLREFASKESEFFLKSVYGPLGEEWPAMSFTQPQLATYLHQRYRPASDFILYTATAGDTTEAEEQRGRLLSVLTIDLTKVYPTPDIVSDESWRWAQDKYPGQWALSFAVLRGWNFDPPPLSASVLPNSYSLMGQYPHRGMVYRIPRDELAPLMDLPVTEVPLSAMRTAARTSRTPPPTTCGRSRTRISSPSSAARSARRAGRTRTWRSTPKTSASVRGTRTVAPAR
jgi:hypothetical protein